MSKKRHIPKDDYMVDIIRCIRAIWPAMVSTRDICALTGLHHSLVRPAMRAIMMQRRRKVEQVVNRKNMHLYRWIRGMF